MVSFLSQFAMSISGFLATIVLTRTLGQEQYGAYVVVLSVLAWAAIAGNLGLTAAVRKRVSEATEGNFVVSGILAQIALYAIVAICLWFARPYLNSYMEIEATSILIVMLGVSLGVNLVRAVLQGQHLVHVSSILSPVEWTIRSIVQVTLVLAGFGIAGAFAGYVVGAIVAIVIGSCLVSVDYATPTREDFRQLRSYAQFSWLASVKGRTFLSMDTIILAFFVTNSLIGVYEVAWNLASLFAIFGSSITRTLFPEMSKISSERGVDGHVSGLLRVSLAYTGLIIIPGFAGAILVGDVVLTVYGSGFETGYYILLVLTFARLLYGYQSQFMNTIDAVDRPDLTFRINAVFVAINLTLNILLTAQFGWYGAATATTASAAVGLGLGYYYATNIMDVIVPVGEITKQWLAAGIMAAVVFVGRVAIEDSLPIVLVLIGVGAVVYLAALLALSQEFRTTVEDNLPGVVSVPGFK
ncbi:oligosaccharide flippase family protein [Halorarum salinum]|uniref:Polysaccharide biosynthesis protein n=1 Tax=Halorarum salinum TaxID=2743089 RepID=A0A7D5QI49_9EURY|nr:polysaccharide biosynthesis protein [Halobaculum salinum]